MKDKTSKIVKKCLKGDQKAHREIYDILQPLLFAICRRYHKSTEDAEDAFHESFIKVYHGLNSWDAKKGTLEAWAKRITVNVIINDFHKNGKKHFISTDTEQSIDIPSTIEVDSDINFNELISLLDKVPDKQRLVFNLYAIEGYSHKEIGDQLNITEITSRSQYMRARNALIQLYHSTYKIIE